MQIQWKGQFCFFITAILGKQEQGKLLIDPYSDSTGMKFSPIETDVVLMSSNTPEHSNLKATKGEPPFVISFPGEYEVKGMFVQGIPNGNGGTIYTIEAEGIKLCHLGGLGGAGLKVEQIEMIGDIDILFVPVGGGDSLDAKAASHVVSQIEPKMVIPMAYKQPKLKKKLDSVEAFVKIMGLKNGEVLPKLSVKVRDLSGEETKITILSS
ncbi:MAG TPA: lactamase [Candidatus Wildermuthbacteria bacterium]|nr:MBL fold metallo-hydrolase [Patescibacteria group bacterium]HEA84431.1 lactamase [Candidatus Wildermuthbacteria bacterium]